jgi:hypothetical protein
MTEWITINIWLFFEKMVEKKKGQEEERSEKKRRKTHLDDASDGRTDHMGDRRGDFDGKEAGDADEEAEETGDKSSEEEGSRALVAVGEEREDRRGLADEEDQGQDYQRGEAVAVVGQGDR